MIIKVLMLAFGKPNEIREVTIPDNTPKNEILEAVFHYGQNDFQPQNHCSVSVGDVAIVDGKHYLCAAIGWKELTAEQLEFHKKMNRDEMPIHYHL